MLPNLRHETFDFCWWYVN